MDTECYLEGTIRSPIESWFCNRLVCLFYILQVYFLFCRLIFISALPQQEQEHEQQSDLGSHWHGVLPLSLRYIQRKDINMAMPKTMAIMTYWTSWLLHTVFSDLETVSRLDANRLVSNVTIRSIFPIIAKIFKRMETSQKGKLQC